MIRPPDDRATSLAWIVNICLAVTLWIGVIGWLAS
jgi:hypothetical protein